MPKIKKIFNRKFLFYLLILNIITLFYIYSQRNNFQYITTYSKEYKNINYDSKSSDKNLSSYKEFKEEKDSKIKDIEISFDATVYSITEHDNIFQTGPINQGIRMELSKKPSLGIVIGYKNDKKYKGYELIDSKKFKLNNKYNFKIKISNENHLTVFVDNLKTIDTSKNDLKTKDVRTEEENINYKISNIAIGTGFSKTRPFNGKIENLSIKYNFYEKDPNLITLILAFPTIVLFLIIFCLFWKHILRIKNYVKKRLKQKKIIKFEYYPFLISSFPMLFLATNNIDKISLASFIPVFIISLLLVLIIYFILNIFFEYKTSAIISSLILIYFYSAGHVNNFVKNIISANNFIFIYSVFFITLLFLLTPNKLKINKFISNLFKTFSIILIILSLINIIIKIPYSDFFKTNNKQIIKTQQKKGIVQQTSTKPDIYYVILDTYASNWTLKTFFNFDNKEFLDYLKTKDFYIAKNSTSNYRITSLAMASSLNMKYIPKKNGDWNLLQDMFVNNEITKLLTEKGYKFINVNPAGVIEYPNINADVNDNCSQWNEFNSILLKTTILFNSSYLLNEVPRNQVLCAFDFTSKLVSLNGPKFFYVHINSPHWPYVFDKDGGYIPNDQQFDFGDSSISMNINKEGYLKQLIFINKKTEELVENILSKSKTPPIIIIQGDHGPDLYLNSSINKGESMPSDEFIKARMRILNAYYLPNMKEQTIPEDVTPVNSFRYILNHYFDSNYEILNNYNYYTSNEKLFNFIDVTNIVSFTSKEEDNN